MVGHNLKINGLVSSQFTLIPLNWQFICFVFIRPSPKFQTSMSRWLTGRLKAANPKLFGHIDKNKNNRMVEKFPVRETMQDKTALNYIYNSSSDPLDQILK